MRRSESAWDWASGIMDEMVENAKAEGKELSDEEIALLKDLRTMAALIGDKEEFMRRLEGMWDELNKEAQ